MNPVVVILITIFFSAFFSGMEIAFVSSNKLRLELDKKQNRINAYLLNLFTRNPGQYIATMLVGNNIALVVYGIAFANLLEPGLRQFIDNDTLVLFTQTIVSTLIILITAEFLPKTLFHLNPNMALKVFAIPTGFFFILFFPVTSVIIHFSNNLLKRIFKTRYKTKNQDTIFSKIDLHHFINENQPAEHHEQKNMETEVKLFKNALDFSNVKVRECMVPRTEIDALEINTPFDDIHQTFIESGHSKILIYEQNIDNIIGYIHISALYHTPASIREFINKIFIVPETMLARKLFNIFIQEHKSIAVVVDEFGGTSGMVTTEDILEEIFGEIEDEHDTVDLIEQKLDNNEFLFSGRHEIDYLNNTYNLNLIESDEYETLAGFILYHHESIPKINTIITIGNYQFKIEKATHTKIEIVRIKMPDDKL